MNRLRWILVFACVSMLLGFAMLGVAMFFSLELSYNLFFSIGCFCLAMMFFFGAIGSLKYAELKKKEVDIVA